MTEVSYKTVERPYTVSEIDQMRQCVEKLVEGPIYMEFTGDGYCGSGSTYNAQEREAKIEGRLRTYMTNGTAPVELAEAVQEINRVEQEQMEASRARWEARQQNSLATAPA